MKLIGIVFSDTYFVSFVLLNEHENTFLIIESLSRILVYLYIYEGNKVRVQTSCGTLGKLKIIGQLEKCAKLSKEKKFWEPIFAAFYVQLYWTSAVISKQLYIPVLVWLVVLKGKLR